MRDKCSPRDGRDEEAAAAALVLADDGRTCWHSHVVVVVVVADANEPELLPTWAEAGRDATLLVPDSVGNSSVPDASVAVVAGGAGGAGAGADVTRGTAEGQSMADMSGCVSVCGWWWQLASTATTAASATRVTECEIEWREGEGEREGERTQKFAS